MAVSYKRLWKLLIDKDMTKTDLRLAAGLSANVIARMGKGKKHFCRFIAQNLQGYEL